jgi:hypothetical protein
MLKINENGGLLDVTGPPPRPVHILDATMVDLDRPVSFIWCEGPFMNRLSSLLDLIKNSTIAYVSACETDRLLDIDEQIMKTKSSKFKIVWPVQNLITLQNKEEIDNLYGLALHWHWVTGSNIVLIIENLNKYV